MDQTRVVLCMKWGTLYPADYVNVLYRACRRHITGAFRFVCLTDDAAGFIDGIEALPIPDIGLSDWMWWDGAWPKLAVYAGNLYGLTGRALYIDLDMVICASLDPFFDHPAPFLTTDMGPNWRPNHGTGPAEAGTSLFAFTLGAETQILERFQQDPEANARRFEIEQKWVHEHASSMDFWPAGWVVSFKRHLRQPIGLDLFLPPRRPEGEAKVVAFHGKPRPIDLIRTGTARWDRFPHMGRGQVKWMADYWRENGGTVPG